MTTKQKKQLLRIMIAVVLFVAGIVIKLLPDAVRFTNEIPLTVMEWVLFGGAYICVGYPVLWKALRNIAHGQVFDENFLMTIASVGAMIIGEYMEGAAVMIFYQVGELFESVAVGKSRQSISQLVDINPEYANVERDGEVVEVEPDEVQTGELIIIRPGERIPLDGVVVSGASGINTAALTGESAPRDVAEGDEVISGCINTTGVLKVRVSRPYSDSTVARILELVENSAENKAKAENFITRFARIYTPVVVGAAALLAVIPPLIQLIAGDTADWSGWIYKALTFLVVSCPCALVISVPLSYFGGIGGASRQGILVKGASYLDTLSKAKTFVFDKTGTLTQGSFTVSEVVSYGIDRQLLLSYCGAAEEYSTHPIAAAVVSAAKAEKLILTADSAQELPGCGIKAEVQGKTVCVGNLRLMQQCGVDAENIASPDTIVHCAVDGIYAGYIAIRDEVRQHSAEVIGELRTAFGATTVMLTGDRRATGESVAARLGIDKCFTELLPDGKVAEVERLYSEKADGTALVFVGDGINDAPALARADVGVAMGGLGSDAAIEAADIVLMNDDISKLPTAMRIAGKTRSIVWQNIIFALSVKVLVLVLTTFGLANMWAAVFADVGVSVIAILNAMRAMRIK